ncbi:DUF1428 domain-containing protein [Gilvimarinus sp. F26214L]|uniref:DUF1428 domain-containing protein n=1 Tax=Gilvimarinus sp. DZF01 TaxID=3461371 RepID=UPI004045EB42
MSYIDGFVIPVPADNKEAYRKHAALAAEMFKEFGALEIRECWGDDVPEGQLTSMPIAVQLQPGEVVAFGWIVWPDRKTRDEGMGKMMEDPRMADNPMPFDGKRMIYGGFETLLTA